MFVIKTVKKGWDAEVWAVNIGTLPSCKGMRSFDMIEKEDGMPSKPRERSEGDFYHVYTRAAGRILLFEDDNDRRRFLQVLSNGLKNHPGALLAWCLMNNHYHLLVRMELESLSESLRVANMAYAQYFNNRYDRTGHLFQSRFGSQAIKSDEQLLCAMRYVHRNPAEANIAPVEEYPWSSYGEYLGRPARLCACDTGFMLDMVGGRDAFVTFHKMEGDGGYSFIDAGTLRSRTRSMPDAKAIEVGASILGRGWRAILPMESAAERAAHLRELRNAGLGITQIERLTGISRGVIQYATQNHVKRPQGLTE